MLLLEYWWLFDQLSQGCMTEPVDGRFWVKKIDVSNRVEDKIPWEAGGIFQRNFYKNVFGDPRSFIQQLPGKLDMLKNMTHDCNVEAFVFIWNMGAIKNFAFNPVPGCFFSLSFPHRMAISQEHKTCQQISIRTISSILILLLPQSQERYFLEGYCKELQCY